jgi:hypothetical protein
MRPSRLLSIVSECFFLGSDRGISQIVNLLVAWLTAVARFMAYIAPNP